MLEKLTPNQRLMLAVALSIAFFVVYTAIFPPVQPEVAENTSAQQNVHLKTTSAQQQQTTSSNVPADSSNYVAPQNNQPVVNALNTILTVHSKDYILKIDTLGRISSKELLQEKFNNKDGGHAQLIPADGMKPLYLRFMDETLNKEAMSVAYSSKISELSLDGSAKKVTITQNLSSLSITKELTFYADGHYDVDIKLSQDKRYFIYLGQRPKVNEKEQMMSVVGALVYTDDELLTIIADGDAETRKSFTGVELVASFDQYNASVMYGFKKDTTVVIDRDRDDNPVVYFDGMQNISFHGYVGPKDYATLKSIKPILTNVIEYGWFTFASKPLFQFLSFLYGIFGNWGWAIIALTLTIRAILYPLTYKGMVSMQKIKELSPKLKEIKEKYKGDPQRMNAATMEMYKKHNANPLGGCLPMLLQIPIFFAIYRVLLNAVELQGAPWMLWVTDLSRMDEFYVLPILMGASMFFQQRLTPNNFTDPMQEKIMKYLPVIFTFFFLTFPSGLVLYWFVNNLFSIAQQFIVNQQFANAKDAKAVVENIADKKVVKKDD
ncbi:MAG: membrane protein insertase YidC [Epsilonproteobacteria bacterium]|nr:membrane protein insertase YidC [Campylobacterota bacterium]